jgi:hypothetical protein
MTLRRICGETLRLSALLLIFAPLLPAEAQDVDVPNNLTMHDSADGTVGNVLKEGVPFIHNFGTNNTFLGSRAGNFTMTGLENSALGAGALEFNTTGSLNTASGAGALEFNTTGVHNSASGWRALSTNSTGDYNTASGSVALSSNSSGRENTASGSSALRSNTTGAANTATGVNALFLNTEGNSNTATGHQALFSNTSGSLNTAIGYRADVPFGTGNLTNATAIGAGAVVDDSNKIRLGNDAVTVIEGQVPYTFTSDRNQKENIRPVNGEEVLSKIRGLSLASWNYKGQDRKRFRHYGPIAQDFFAAFGRDAVGKIGTPTTINSGDLDGILMIAAQALERRTIEQEKEIAQLKARLEALERRGCEVAANVSAGL